MRVMRVMRVMRAMQVMQATQQTRPKLTTRRRFRILHAVTLKTWLRTAPN